ncbi:hypothetical protein NDU88_004567 [Pleurodeles waltl]|uniref:Uncharacterized protein n=1 Tax=Pleurodeles waltl TaxID=8319 RepID=A0AAV7UFV1_PLEWA|nr:hypothetical protein NDU88_004567 [Pleurodeles waltl]
MLIRRTPPPDDAQAFRSSGSRPTGARGAAGRSQSLSGPASFARRAAARRADLHERWGGVQRLRARPQQSQQSSASTIRSGAVPRCKTPGGSRLGSVLVFGMAPPSDGAQAPQSSGFRSTGVRGHRTTSRDPAWRKTESGLVVGLGG